MCKCSWSQWRKRANNHSEADPDVTSVLPRARIRYPLIAAVSFLLPLSIVPAVSLRRDIPHWYNIVVIAATAYYTIPVVFPSLMPVSKSRVYQLAQDWKGFDAIKHLVVLYVLPSFLTATITKHSPFSAVEIRTVQSATTRDPPIHPLPSRSAFHSQGPASGVSKSEPYEDGSMPLAKSRCRLC